MGTPKRIARVAIVGRANVGKSSIFNALCGERKSIVEDYAGVTRDSISALVVQDGLSYELIDTGGLFAEEELFLEHVEQAVMETTKKADIIVCVFDGLVGPHPLDAELVQKIRQLHKPILWVVNKTEKEQTKLGALEFMEFGIDTPILTSAAHREGTAELRRQIESTLNEIGISGQSDHESEEDAIRVAIVGKPNVGKSTLVNRLCGEERVIVSPHAGTTRDSVDVPITRDGRRLILVDTAGLRKKTKIEKGSIERFSALRTLRALGRADVVLLLLDSTGDDIVTEQDKRIATLIHERGLPVVLVVNKWDALEKDHKTSKRKEEEIFEELPFLRYAPILFVSALSGKRCPALYETVVKLHDSLELRIGTGQLNPVVEKLFTAKPPPPSRGREIKFYYATQVRERPPTFLLFCNYPKSISQSYERYLKSGIRKVWPFEGVDIKLILRKRSSQKEE